MLVVKTRILCLQESPREYSFFFLFFLFFVRWFVSVSLNERKNGYLCKSSICGSKVIARVPELYIITNFGSIVVALNQKL